MKEKAKPSKDSLHSDKNKLHYAEALKRSDDFFKTDHYQKRLAKRKGFAGMSDYYEYLAKRKGYPSFAEYKRLKLKERGINSETEHQAKLAEALGLESSTDYQRLKMLERLSRPRNQKFSAWLRRCLGLLGKNPKWLAERIGVSLQACYTYLEGYSIPRELHLLKIRHVLAQAAIPEVKLPEPPELRKMKHKATHH